MKELSIMSKIRRWFVACAALALASVAFAGDHAYIINDYKWNFTDYGDGTASITDVVTNPGGLAPSGSLEIPSTINGYTVVDISAGVFYGCANLTSVTLPETLRSIGDNAFRECVSLELVKFPRTVSDIGSKAFYGCENLASVVFEENNLTVWSDAFYGCDKLTRVYINSSTLAIWSGCMFENEYANPLYFAEELYGTYIGGHLLRLSIPNYYKFIGDYAFAGCDATNAVIPASVKTIGKGAFFCSGLESVTIGSGVTSIGEEAFYCCNLTSVTIPDNVKTIGGSAFRNCDELTSVTIGSGVTSIGTDAFYYCTSVDDVYCYADPAKLTWDEDECDDFKEDGSTKIHVRASQLSAYENKFGSTVNAIFVGDLATDGTWTVKYHKNDPNGGTDVTRGQNIPVGETKRLLYLDSALKWAIKDEDGFSYIFLGWAKSKTGAAVYSNGQEVRDLVAKGKVMHLYAVWQKRAYEVCFHSNDEDGLVEYQEFRPNIAKNLLWLDSGLGWTRSGYDFLGWAKSPTSTAVVYANGQKVNNLVAQGQTLHLYAVWRDRRWTIRYHRNYSSGDNTYEDQKIPVGASVKLLWLDSQLKWTRDGYWFKGWAKSRTAGAAYANGQTVKDLVPGGQVLHLYGAWGKKTN